MPANAKRAPSPQGRGGRPSVGKEKVRAGASSPVALRKGFGSQVSGNLKRAKDVRDGGRGAKLTAKNLNENYQGARVAALPPMVKLEAGDVSIPDQLNTILSENSVKLIDLFREWDEDASGTVSRKEFVKAMPLLGLDVPEREVLSLFDEWDRDQGGEISLRELNKQLRRGGEVQLAARMQAGGAGAIELESKNSKALRGAGR